MNLAGKTAVIVGGGKIALRKAKGLEGTGAKIMIISPSVIEGFGQLPHVTWKQKEFEAKDLEGAHLIFAATNKKEINNYVCQCAKDNQWVNDTSESKRSSFITPAVVRREKFIFAISTSGACPALAKELKQELEKRYDNQIGNVIEGYAERRKKK